MKILLLQCVKPRISIRLQIGNSDTVLLEVARLASRSRLLSRINGGYVTIFWRFGLSLRHYRTSVQQN